MKIIKDIEVLRINILPDRLPCRDELIEKIRSKAILNAGNLFLIGDTGSGKTASVKKALEGEKDIILIEINCATHNTFSSITKKTIEGLKGEEYKEAGKNRGNLTNDLIKVLKTKRKKKVVILLDEIDKLVDNNDRNHADVLIPLIENSKFNLIIISNKHEALNNLDIRIKSRLQTEKILVPRYNALEITEILKDRAERGLYEDSWDEIVIAQIARRCFQTSGDIRDGISLLFEIAQLAEVKDKQVTMELFKEAEERLQEVEWDKLISELTLHQVIIITSAVELSIKNPEKYAEIKEVFSFYCNKVAEKNSFPVSFRQFENLVKKLEYRNLIKCSFRTPKNRKGRLSIIQTCFELDWFNKKYGID